MKIFITWSESRSRDLADQISTWLKNVVQSIDTFFSPNDVASGKRWSGEIFSELANSDRGLLCLTPENIENPWVLFEAGALAGNLGDRRAIPLLFGLKSSEVRGPLSELQCVEFSEEGMRKLLHDLFIDYDGDCLSVDRRNQAFDKWWDDLSAAVTTVLDKPHPEREIPVRSSEDMLSELLTLARQNSKGLDRTRASLFHMSIAQKEANNTFKHTIDNQSLIVGMADGRQLRARVSTPTMVMCVYCKKDKIEDQMCHHCGRQDYD